MLHHISSTARRGAVLMVVLAMLALFSVVAVGFVIFSEQEAVTAKINVESQVVVGTHPDVLFSYLLNQFVYDTGDSQSALYRQSLLLNMYGHGRDPATGVPVANDVPFQGSGKLHINQLASAADFYYYSHYGAYAHLGIDLNQLTNFHQLGAFNPPYTFPDHNAPFLGMIRADGMVTARSFVRVGPGNFDPYDPANFNFWLDPSYQPGGQNLTPEQKRAITPRPIPWDDRKCHVLKNPDGSIARTFFPPPADKTGDVKNLPPGTAVLYRDPATGQMALSYGNDSYWFDANFPIQVGKDGKRYKPLFAMFVMDLNGKLNVNAHFNNKGVGGGHASNQGLGAWEVGPPPAAAGPEAAAFLQEFDKLLTGRLNGARTPGRYFANPTDPTIYADGKPPPGPGDGMTPITAPQLLAGQGYSPIDFDAANPGAGRTAPFALPGTDTNAKSWSGFPYYPPGWENSAGGAANDHPMLYNYYAPSGDQRFSPANLELLYRMGDTGTDAMTSDLVRLCPNTFKNGSLMNRLRWQLTTTSPDHAVYGMVPWFRFMDPATRSQYTLKLATGELYPKGAPAPMSSTGGLNAETLKFLTPQPKEMLPRRLNALFHANPAEAALPPYPPLNADGRISDTTAYGNAVHERQKLAAQFYYLLIQTAGAYDPTQYVAMGTYPAPTSDEVHALRWLAQLAVNMVDYIDEDDYLTPFNWLDAQLGIASADFLAAPEVAASLAPLNVPFVFGNELPRLVINEAYAEYENFDPNDTKKFRVSLWVELHNPLPTDQCTHAGIAALELPAPAMGGSKLPAYKLVVAKADKNGVLRMPWNVTGQPEAIWSEVADWNPANDPNVKVKVLPGKQNFDAGAPQNDPIDPNNYAIYPEAADRGWYFIGPGRPLPKGFQATTAVKIPRAIVDSPQLNYEDQNADGTPKNEDRPVLLLRRLACPHLPENNDPASAQYNPYITVDFMEQVYQRNKRERAVVGGRLVETNVANRISGGRRQPYAAHHSQLRAQAPADPNFTNQPKHTFLRHNYKNATPPPNDEKSMPTDMLQLPFDWLVHLDRRPTSAFELLHVSAFKPHELTQQFVAGDNPAERFQHLAPWFDANQRYYRFLELLELSFPVNQLGNVRQGKINLNTMDRETFFGLCDMPEQQAEIDQVWQRIVASRGDIDPATGPRIWNGSLEVFNAGDVFRGPLWSLGVGPQVDLQPGNYGLPGLNGTRGIVDTWVRPNDAAQADKLWGSDRRRLLELTNAAHPYDRARLLTKIGNNVTTRSNAFAVWVTVGFFEVIEVQEPRNPSQPFDAVNNPLVKRDKLGAELGRSEGKQVRHRMFAIIDRTQFALNQELAPAVPAGYHVPISTQPNDPAGNPYFGIDPRRPDPRDPRLKPIVQYWTIIQ